jgi:uncharacterized protein (TIGR03083 family)
MAGSVDMTAERSALRNGAARTAALLRTVQQPDAPVPGLSWTVAETAAHLVAELQHYAAFVTGERDAGEYVDLAAGDRSPGEHNAISNARILGEFTERDVHRLAGMLELAAEGFLEASASRSGDEPVLTTAGVPMTVPVMTAALLGEQLIHGLDIARAQGARWPIAREDALRVIAGVMALVPHYVDRQRTAGQHLSFELRFRGGPRYRLTVDDGTAAVTKPNGRVDCWIAADPVAFVLVGYGRAGQFGQALRGRIVAGGRKPWLGLKFGGLLTKV